MTVRKDIIKKELERLAQKNSRVNTEVPQLHSVSYNCWGFTTYALGFDEKPRWLSQQEMINFLESYTVPVKKPKAGDIAVFKSYGEDYLLHTAVLTTGTGSCVHKPGSCPLEKCTIAEIYENHPSYQRLAEYRRVL